jgi:MFS family permease
MVRINPLVDIIFVNSTKPEQSSTVIGLSRTIWAIPSIIAPLLAAAIVTSYGGINAQGIRPLYYLQLVVVVFVFVFIALMLQTPAITTTPKTDELESKGFIQDFRGFFAGERWLKRWVVLRIIRSIIFSMSGPFWSLWMVDVKGATAPILGAMGTVSTVISVFMPVFAGRLADRVGRKKAFYILRPITYLTVSLMILAPTPEFLILAEVFGGIGGASFIPFITMHWEMVPQEKRGRWYGIEAFINIFSIPATMLGGFLWQHGFMVEVLLLPSLIEALVVIPIFFTIPDTLSRSRQ